MSSTTEWRKLCEGNNSFGADALRAACDRVDELEQDVRIAARRKYLERAEAAEARLDEQANLLGIANEQWGKTIARAEAAEARLKVAVEALARIEPFLPDIDYGVAARHSEHCQAAAQVRAALAKLRGEP